MEFIYYWIWTRCIYIREYIYIHRCMYIRVWTNEYAYAIINGQSRFDACSVESLLLDLKWMYVYTWIYIYTRGCIYIGVWTYEYGYRMLKGQYVILFPSEKVYFFRICINWFEIDWYVWNTYHIGSDQTGYQIFFETDSILRFIFGG